MRRIITVAAVLLLVGQGCKVGQQAEFMEQSPPAAEPATPAQPATGTGEGAEPAQPANPPSDGIQAEIDANLGMELKAGVNVNAGGAFAPATITVKKGTTVTWTNTGNASVWIASDPHPVHSGYAGFDQGAAMGMGESWSFTFEQAGTWGYHNHLNPFASAGTVVVTE